MDFAAVANFSLFAYVVVFVGGIITSIGPCNMAMIPLVMAFVGGQKEIHRGRSLALSAAFALGLAVTLTGLGVFAAVVGGLIGGTSRIWYYGVALVCIVMGMQWAGLVHVPLPSFGAGRAERVKRKGLWGALLLGLLSGFVASGCATPALAAILTLVMAKGALAYGASLLLAYGLGRGVPIVLVGTFTGWVKQGPRMTEWTARIGQFSGVLMILIGLYFLWIA